MKFDVQKQGLEDKARTLPGLLEVLRGLEANEGNVTEEPARRVVLPYSGPKPFQSEKWKQRR